MVPDVQPSPETALRRRDRLAPGNGARNAPPLRGLALKERSQKFTGSEARSGAAPPSGPRQMVPDVQPSPETALRRCDRLAPGNGARNTPPLLRVQDPRRRSTAAWRSENGARIAPRPAAGVVSPSGSQKWCQK